jgi:hypothetical protein
MRIICLRLNITCNSVISKVIKNMYSMFNKFGHLSDKIEICNLFFFFFENRKNYFFFVEVGLGVGVGVGKIENDKFSSMRRT